MGVLPTTFGLFSTIISGKCQLYYFHLKMSQQYDGTKETVTAGDYGLCTVLYDLSKNIKIRFTSGKQHIISFESSFKEKQHEFSEQWGGL